MAHAEGQTSEAVSAMSRDVHAPVHEGAPPASQPRPIQVLAQTPPPAPIEVVIRWLRKKAAMGTPIRISPLLAQRIAAELEEKVV